MISEKTRIFSERINIDSKSGIPFRDYRFWIIQLLVLLIDVSHIFLEETGILIKDSELYILSVSPFLVPVVYGALNFGRRGAIPTAAWALLLWVPEINSHNSTTQLGILIQFGIIGVIATIVANRVDRENIAARVAKEASLRLWKAKENLKFISNLPLRRKRRSENAYLVNFMTIPLQSLVVATTEIGAVIASDNANGAHSRLLRVQETSPPQS